MQNSSQRSTRLVQISLCLLCQFAFLAAVTLQAYATNGLPQSKKFGFGARVDPWGEQVDYALEAAADNGLDWIAVDFDWKKSWPSSNSSLDLANLDRMMSFAAQNGLAVLLSITNPPAWATTSAGPDPEITAGLVAQFIRLYPETLKAIELFPGANTKLGWGATPNPAEYTRLLKNVEQNLLPASSSSPGKSMPGASTTIIAAGLIPVSSPDAESMDDLDFLRGLYKAGAAEYMPILSVRFPALTGDPLSDPRESNPWALRHYELIRNLMLENNHSKGLIWVTGFSLPDLAPAQNSDTSPRSENSGAVLESAETRWLNNAYQMMKSQLYLGAAFYDCLNPPAATDPKATPNRCLIRVDQGSASTHPAFSSLGYLRSLLNKQNTQVTNSGPGGLSVPFDIKAVWNSAKP